MLKQSLQFHIKFLTVMVVTLGVLFMAQTTITNVQVVAAAEDVKITDDSGKRPGDPGIAYCGDINKNAVATSINIGCKGKGNAILDMLFAVIRFLTLGVSLVIIASMVVAGLQFTASRGDPQATAASLKRMASNASALLLFIFAYAILNWLVPNTLLQ